MGAAFGFIKASIVYFRRMESPEKIRQKTVTDYSWIAQEAERTGPDAWRDQICRPIFDPIHPLYLAAPGYVAAANLGLGCAIPPLFANLKAGEKVVDLGCAAGVDAFIARFLVGDQGWVTGVDLTPELVTRAKAIARERGFQNMDFREGDIEQLPLPDQAFEVATSNGVFSLIPDKFGACREIFRVLKVGGRFVLADLMCLSDLPDTLMQEAIQFTGCFNGIYAPEIHILAMEAAGFSQIEVLSMRHISLPDEMTKPHFPGLDFISFQQKGLAAVVLMGRK